MKVLVIGGGISGLFVSYYLLRAGHDVVLADAPKGKVRTSAYNAGQLSTRGSFTDIFAHSKSVSLPRASVKRDPRWFRLARGQTRDTYEGVAHPLSLRSLELYRRFFAEEKAKVDLVSEVLDLHTKIRGGGGPGTGFVGPRELADLGYKGFEGGWLVEELSLHSGKLLAFLGSRIEEMGGRSLKGEARVKSGGGRISTATVGDRRVQADAHVVAAGSWSREVCAPLGYDPMVIPARGLVLFYRTHGKQVIDIPAHYEDEGVTATQHDKDTVRLSSYFELAGFDPEFSTAKRAALFRRVTSHFSRPHRLALIEAGVGFRPSTPDQLPLVGKIPGVENGYILSGSCRKGMALAPALAHMLIGCVLESKEPDPFLRALDPSRFA